MLHSNRLIIIFKSIKLGGLILSNNEKYQDHEHHSYQEHESHTSHGNHEHHHHGNFKNKLFISLILTISAIILSPMTGVRLPFRISFTGSDWIVLILVTILSFYGGEPFLSEAKDEISTKKPGMTTLVALSISIAYIYNLYAFYMNNFSGSSIHTIDFLWELATLILIMLLGHWIKMNAIGNAGNALRKMTELLPNTAVGLTDNNQREKIKISDIHIDDTVEIRTDESIPTGGIIIRGETSVGKLLVTGELKKVHRTYNGDVIGDSINGSGTVQVKVAVTGENGYLSQATGPANQAQNNESKAKLLSDRVTGYLFYFAVSIGLTSFIARMLIRNNVNFALERLVTVLVTAYSHALGLAIPLVTACSTSTDAHNGLIIKNREPVEIIQRIDYIMMDKTETLTESSFSVNHYESFTNELSNEGTLSLFVSSESNSNHPLAISIVDFTKSKDISYATPQEASNAPGIGLEGTVDNKKLKIVNASYLNKSNFDYNKERLTDPVQQGNSISYLIHDRQVIGIIAQGGKTEESSKQMVSDLLSRNIMPVMLAGGNKEVAQIVAEELGASDVYVQLMPEDKENTIQDYQSNGNKIMTVGDGINDVPSLTRTDIGMAIGTGTDVAIELGDAILAKSNPSDIIDLLSLSKSTMKKVVRNLWWSAEYNVIAVPLTAGISTSVGLILSSAVGAILMSLNTITVAINVFTLELK